MTSSNPAVHTCSNCFAEFEWEPYEQDGEDFCCAGCADGGPCICTYGSEPLADEPDDDSLSGDTAATAAEDAEPSEGEGSFGPPAAGGPPGEPPDVPPDAPPLPGEPGEEPPRNGRLAIIRAAIAEMPLPVQEVVTSRLENEGSEDEIGEPFGLTGDEVRELIQQGQAILDRTIGPGFTIRYIGGDPETAEEPAAPEFPPFELDAEMAAAERAEAEEATEGDAPGEPAEGAADAAAEPLPPGGLIARLIESLTDVSIGESAEDRDVRDVLSEALLETGNLFRLASERIISPDRPEESLRAALSAARDDEEPVTLIVENPGDLADFFLALQSSEDIEWVRMESLSEESAVFRLVTTSVMGLVRAIMALGGDMRPTRLRVSGDIITVELPPRARTTERAVPGTGGPVAFGGGTGRGPRFEVSVDAFFGARHFVESNDTQGPPHHHSYRVEASFITTEPERYGFVVGFAEIRQIVESTVMRYSETLLNTEPPFIEIPPTTENLARVFHEQASERLAGTGLPTIRLDRVRVWESPTNSATYSDPGTGTPADAEATA